jgi:GLPGLI family protein
MNKLFIIFFVFIIFSSSCNQQETSDVITSGQIDYQITYLNNDLDKKTRNILPSRMRLMFNDKQASNNIEGFMGMYKLNAFTNFNTRKCSTILKVLDKHYLFKGSKDEQMCCFNTMDDMEIVETGETKTIAGFHCKKAIISLPSTQEKFTIYYTDEISLKHPNATNPYRKVKGVLMEFELELIHLKMRFVAEKYQQLNSKIGYQTSKEVQQVTRSQMTQILNKLME